jgi:hypothetical protein
LLLTQSKLTATAIGMDIANVDKLDGRIDEEFWKRKMGDWRLEEQQVKLALDGLVAAEDGDRPLDAQRV